MPEEVIYYITNYGYMAIFVLVFLQEIGMPNPLPNELLLIFAGYLSFKGLLFFPVVILTAVFADFIGTNMLYFLFYYTGTFVFQKKPKWIPLSSRMIYRLSNKISKGGQLSIFIFRLTPFTRGYTSVITGLTHIQPKIFLPIAFLSALIWATIYVLTGYFLGPSWNIISMNIGRIKFIMLGILLAIICLFLFIYYLKKRKLLKTETGS
jgi:membrane protein DedA with SNARE-associated domain